MADLSSDLAKKVLAADTRNAITKVGNEGQLTSAQRLGIAKAALPHSQARVLALVRRWSAGERLTADELEEIRPTLEDGSALKNLPAAESFPAAVGELISMPTAPPLVLASAPPEKRTGLQNLLPHYAEKYGAALDTIKRWRSNGRDKNDPCPLDHPSALVAWWSRHMKWKVPNGILHAAAAAPSENVSRTPADSAPEPASPPTTAQATAFAGHKIDLSEMQLEADAEVQQARQVLGATMQLLARALNGEGGSADVCQRNWEKAQEVLRKARLSAEQRALKAGQLLHRAAVEHDIAKLTEMLRAIGESAVRLVIERCPSLSAQNRTEVAAAVEAFSVNQQRVLENIDSIRTPDDFAKLLAAA